jgi:hypothetical protein
MYATLSYDVNSGPVPVGEVRAALLELLEDRETCDLLSDTLLCAVTNTVDYLELADDLKAIGTDFPDQFDFVLTLHRAGDPLRSNAAFSMSKAAAIIT